MKFKVASIFGKTRRESDVVDSMNAAISISLGEVAAGAKSVFILRDSEGVDHPDNKGKFLLHQVFKR